ncbi:thermonuclease family protein [bacterium]|nr:thermonuclease family protein [bacterium]
MIRKIYFILILASALTSIQCDRAAGSDPPSSNGGNDDSTTYLIVDVKDGDTIELDNAETIRLVGIDTPEMNYGSTPEPCAVEATEYTETSALGKRCYLVYNIPVGDSLDIYGRTLAFVHILPGSTCLNIEICRAGWSEDWDSFPVRSDYELQFEQAETEAMNADRGIWDTTNNCD